jgi:flavin-dependent dehydrogenase
MPDPVLNVHCTISIEPTYISGISCSQYVDCRMFEYAQEIGVDCHLGTFVDEYFEEEDRAGIIVNGERLEADLLIAAVNNNLSLRR